MDVEEPVVVDGELLTGVDVGVANALAQARAFGYLGPGPLQRHIDHARGFADALLASGIVQSDNSAISAVDLGSGGGVPGLLLLTWWPRSRWTFVDSNQRRMGTLSQVLSDLNLTDRSAVRVGRAEHLARVPELRGLFDVVVARGFSAPGVTAECGSPFLRIDGVMVVSEPPIGEDRWSDTGLARLGLRRQALDRGQFRFFMARQERRTPDSYPRAVGVPSTSPLF